MKVKCTRILDSAGKPVESSPWLRVGQIYWVMSIFATASEGLKYQVMESLDPPLLPQSMGFFPAACFETINTRVPSIWALNLRATYLQIGPRGWQSEGFLERLYDGDKSAFDAFTQACTSMRDETD